MRVTYCPGPPGASFSPAPPNPPQAETFPHADGGQPPGAPAGPRAGPACRGVRALASWATLLREEALDLGPEGSSSHGAWAPRTPWPEPSLKGECVRQDGAHGRGAWSTPCGPVPGPCSMGAHAVAETGPRARAQNLQKSLHACPWRVSFTASWAEALLRSWSPWPAFLTLGQFRAAPEP